MYLGASSFSALYTRSRILNRMRNLIGSQWSLMRTGVICSYFLVLDTIRVALFCSSCSFAIKSCFFQLGEHCSNPSETSPVTASLFLLHLLLTHVSLFQYFSGESYIFDNTFDMGCHDQLRVKHSSQIPHRLRWKGHISPCYGEWLNVQFS